MPHRWHPERSCVILHTFANTANPRSIPSPLRSRSTRNHRATCVLPPAGASAGLAGFPSPLLGCYLWRLWDAPQLRHRVSLLCTSVRTSNIFAPRPSKDTQCLCVPFSPLHLPPPMAEETCAIHKSTTAPQPSHVIIAVVGGVAPPAGPPRQPRPPTAASCRPRFSRRHTRGRIVSSTFIGSDGCFARFANVQGEDPETA
ncbi:hypothetical protein L226DRAFT_245199 [Lentinus tigrinus ALCF2SS1-7]|uniref:uncharacterized protein n=1 Tax=Lentinus tigrinus ALCF2SS1-7 TaxID=1328758 RepID=UPI001165D4B0|nr:hypothetical protein L226DRAFT_245199 [Lentinus tigrinus ALCF2SS1-7]